MHYLRPDKEKSFSKRRNLISHPFIHKCSLHLQSCNTNRFWLQEATISPITPASSFVIPEMILRCITDTAGVISRMFGREIYIFIKSIRARLMFYCSRGFSCGRKLRVAWFPRMEKINRFSRRVHKAVKVLTAQGSGDDDEDDAPPLPPHSWGDSRQGQEKGPSLFIWKFRA